MDITFMNYIPTPGEKHLGIATVNYKNMILLRFKVTAGRDGKGTFIACASHKVGSGMGSDAYTPSFVLDSRIEHEQVLKLIRENIPQHAISDELPF